MRERSDLSAIIRLPNLCWIVLGTPQHDACEPLDNRTYALHWIWCGSGIPRSGLLAAVWQGHVLVIDRNEIFEHDVLFDRYSDIVRAPLAVLGKATGN